MCYFCNPEAHASKTERYETFQNWQRFIHKYFIHVYFFFPLILSIFVNKKNLQRLFVTDNNNIIIFKKEESLVLFFLSFSQCAHVYPEDTVFSPLTQWANFHASSTAVLFFFLLFFHVYVYFKRFTLSIVRKYSQVTIFTIVLFFSYLDHYSSVKKLTNCILNGFDFLGNNKNKIISTCGSKLYKLILSQLNLTLR